MIHIKVGLVQSCSNFGSFVKATLFVPRHSRNPVVLVVDVTMDGIMRLIGLEPGTTLDILELGKRVCKHVHHALVEPLSGRRIMDASRKDYHQSSSPFVLQETWISIVVRSMTGFF